MIINESEIYTTVVRQFADCVPGVGVEVVISDEIGSKGQLHSSH